MKEGAALLLIAALLFGRAAYDNSAEKDSAQPDAKSTVQAAIEVNEATSAPSSRPSTVGSEEADSNMTSLTITIGDTVFTAKLYANAASQALLQRFPMALNMTDLHRNEKYYYLPNRLPTDAERIEAIKAGDLMLYGSDCLVLFYESFSTQYSYTKLGYIEDDSGLAKALGSGSVEVRFAVGE